MLLLGNSSGSSPSKTYAYVLKKNQWNVIENNIDMYEDLAV